jgi:recombination protein RecA
VTMTEYEHIDIEDILAGLDKDTLKMVRRGSEISKRKIPTVSFGLNQILDGGLSIGKQHTFWGNEQSAKSATMLQTIALNQRLGVPCAYIDAEHSFDYEWAARLGVDTDRILVSQASTISDVADLQVQLIDKGAELIVIDSTSSLMPKSFWKDGDMKNFDNAGQIGQFAKDLGQMCKMVQGINFSAAIVHISQVRMDLGNSFMPGMKPSGGKETEHNDSLRVRMFSSKSEKKAIIGQVQRGDILIEERIGRKVTWSIDKNKINGRYGEGEYDFYTSGEFIGVDRASELIAYGVKYGVVEKGGAWYTINDQRFQGDTKAVRYVRENPDVAAKIEADIIAQSF